MNGCLCQKPLYFLAGFNKLFYWTQKTLIWKNSFDSKQSSCSRHCCVLFIFSFLSQSRFLTIRDVLFCISPNSSSVLLQQTIPSSLNVSQFYDDFLWDSKVEVNYFHLFYDAKNEETLRHCFVWGVKRRMRKMKTDCSCWKFCCSFSKGEKNVVRLMISAEKSRKKSLHNIAKIATNCKINFVISVSRSRPMSTVQTDNDSAVVNAIIKHQSLLLHLKCHSIT